MAKRKKKRKGKAAVAARRRRLQGDSVRYKCLECGIEEDIPRFDCEKCGRLMEPIEYEGVHGEVYRIKGKAEDNDKDYIF